MTGTIITIAAVAIIGIIVFLREARITHWRERAEQAEAALKTVEAELEKAKVRQKADILAEKLKAAWAAKPPETFADTATEGGLVDHETTVTNTRPEGGAA